MQNRKKLTASFRRLFLKGADWHEKQLFARWFSQLDLSEGEIFRNQAEAQELERKMEQNLHDHFFSKPASTNILRLPFWVSAAAAVLIIIAGSLWFMPMPKSNNKIGFSKSYTTTGQRKMITLADGSKITLSNSSRIKFPKTFADSIREVFLEGEAFFDVVHNQAKPFIVRTGKLNVHVLGTSFNVRHYDTDQTIDVVVATGKVGVYAKDIKQTWMLTPGNLLAYNPQTRKAVASIVDPADYTGWQNGELIFNNEPMEHICKQLERWYGVAITIKNPLLKNKTIRLKQKGENLQTVLKMLGKVGGFKYEIKNKTVTLW